MLLQLENTACWYCFCAYMYICVVLCMSVGVQVCVQGYYLAVCVEAGAHIWCLLPLLSTLFSETGCLTEPGACWLGWAGWPGDFSVHSPTTPLIAHWSVLRLQVHTAICSFSWGAETRAQVFTLAQQTLVIKLSFSPWSDFLIFYFAPCGECLLIHLHLCYCTCSRLLIEAGQPL